MPDEYSSENIINSTYNEYNNNCCTIHSENISLIKGQIIYDILNKKHYRLLYIPNNALNSDKNQVINSGLSFIENGYWICIDSTSNVPEEFDLGVIQDGLKVFRYRLVPDDFGPIIPDKISQAAKNKMEKAYSLIENLVNVEPDIYERSKRLAMLKKVEEQSKAKIGNLYIYLGKYWRGGMVKEALLPKLFKIGTGRKEDFVAKNRLGRHSKYPGQNGKILNETDFQNFNKYIKKIYLSTKKPKFKEVYDNMLAHCYSIPRFEGDTSPTPLPPEEKPSYSQFYYWYRKNVDSVEERRSRLGENKFNLTSRGITGRSESEILGPGMVYQIDATIADYYLVQSKNRNAIIGRPVIFFVRDVWSRMITGVHITLENASCNCALMALKNCAEDKVEFCRRYGIKIEPEEWPCHHLPRTLIGDNGEIAGYGIEPVISKLGILVENTPPYRGDLKAVIESFFNTINIHLHYLVPGHVDKDAGERGAIDRKKDACIDLPTFAQLIIRCILFYNNKWYMKTYMKTPRMRLHNIKPIPLELWNYGIQYESGALPVISQDQINQILLPKSEATVTEKGIKFSGLYYTCDYAESNAWFSKARISGRFKVKIAYDPSCLEVIFILRQDESLIECRLLPKSAVYSGISEDLIKDYHEDDLQEMASYSQEEERGKTNLIMEIEATVSRCAKEKSHEVHDAVSARLGKMNIRKNRADEKDELSGKAQGMKDQEFHDDNVHTAKASMESCCSRADEVMNDYIEKHLIEKGLLKKDK